MKVFMILPDDNGWGGKYRYQINASHKWGLPGVACSRCGNTWSLTGVNYPSVDLSVLSNANRFNDPRPVSVEEFLFLRKQISRFLPPNSYQPPGTALGPLVGNAWGKFGDFSWLNPWTLLINEYLYNEFRSLDVVLPEGKIPELKFRSKSQPNLVEPQIEPLVKLAQSSFSNSDSPPCPSCGYNAQKLKLMIVDRPSIPPNVNLFRPIEHPTRILTSEEFINVVIMKKLKGIIYKEVHID